MTGASEPRFGPWRRWLAEFVVIVVGVLVALGVDAAREAREERAREAAYLEQLHADLTTTADSLRAAIAVEETARAGGDRLLDALDGGELPPPDMLGTWLQSATNWSTFQPNMGTVTALVESGDFRLLRDPILRQAVLQYHSEVVSALRIIDGITPHTWRTVERLGALVNWRALNRPDAPGRFPVRWEVLASDRAFHGALADLGITTNNRIFALRGLRDALDPLLARLESVVD
ncbi:MAG: hypothetical protein RQ751_04705 [Longimicrobiales bacterium]|nr:hypothetical protein [Longimicrobiales bacterium]